jgi:hypothetical protein
MHEQYKSRDEERENNEEHLRRMICEKKKTIGQGRDLCRL